MQICSERSCNLKNVTENFDLFPIFYCYSHNKVHICKNGETCSWDIRDDYEVCSVSGKMNSRGACSSPVVFMKPVSKNDDYHFTHYNIFQRKMIENGCPLTHARDIYSTLCQIKLENISFLTVIDMTVYILSHKLKTVFIKSSNTIRKKKKVQWLKRWLEKNVFTENFPSSKALTLSSKRIL